ncbi:transposase [Streptomyces sp. ISL-86]|uniref:transposase n=1 Tax=Streptomyces sp. ISL-86 TaxID=2819187 RepID=UPI001BEA8698|nr:transposase [Streptomyces sp. ISL-86]
MNESDDLDDHEWNAVRPLVPRCGPGGPDYRAIVNGILWQQSGGRRWHDLRTRYGPWHRCAERLRLWSTDGTWQNIPPVLPRDPGSGVSALPAHHTACPPWWAVAHPERKQFCRSRPEAACGFASAACCVLRPGL